MAEITYPGVYVEEVPGDPRSIEGVPTSTAAFAGWTAKGPTERAVHVRSWAEFADKFGGLDERSLLGYAVHHFLDNGGTQAFIVRVAAEDGSVLKPNEKHFEDALLPGDGKCGLYHLDKVDIFNLLCVPGETNAETIIALQKFCLQRRAFLIVDCAEAATFDELKNGPGKIAGEASINSAFYFPWVLAPDKLQKDLPREFPPCGFIAGIFARTDLARGVWKAPAGVEAKLKGATGVGRQLSDDTNGTLNKQAINCIRNFPTHGTVAWGARTLRGSDAFGSEWKYVSVRRTALFIEESLARGLRWVVFEPNGEPLWAHIRQIVGTFMHRLFLQGAFQGTTPREAYFVKCDRETMTQEDLNLGRVNVIVGFAPLKPAEFVVLRLQQMTRRDDDDD